MERHLTAAVTAVLLAVASSVSLPVAAACLQGHAVPGTLPACCATPAPAPATCESHEAPAPATVQHPCCCDDAPAAPAAPAPPPTTVQPEGHVLLASAPVTMAPPALKGIAPVVVATVSPDASPPTFLLACAFLI